MNKTCFQFEESGTCSYGDKCRYSHLSTSRSTKSKRNQKSKGGRHAKRYGATKANRISSANNVTAGHLEDFFAQYPEYEYDKYSSSTDEFYRMCHYFGWDKDDWEKKEAHEDFRTALVHQFNAIYGSDEDDIESWLGLSNALHIFPLPESPGEAKEIFRGKFVNLVDLVDVGSTGDEIEQFHSLEELVEYTVETGKYFPKESAYAGGVLRFLLREILSTYAGKSGGRKRR